MPKTELTLGALKDLDLGKADAAFKAHVHRVGGDIKDRPLDLTARKVVLEVSIKPDPDTDGTCDRVKVQMQITSTVPKQRTRVYDMALHGNGALSFNPDSMDNVDQETMDFGPMDYDDNK